jgi:hypothetical protein
MRNTGVGGDVRVLQMFGIVIWKFPLGKVTRYSSEMLLIIIKQILEQNEISEISM